MKRTAPVVAAMHGPAGRTGARPEHAPRRQRRRPCWARPPRPHACAPDPQPPASTEAALELKGETNGPAPDSEQNPVEVSITQRLNAQVAERNELADQTDRANAAAHAEAVHEYREEKADVEAETERQQIDAQINAQSRAEYDADQEARYQKAMADWRATVAACERGNTPRCQAGSMPARPGKLEVPGTSFP
jgi:hypothetical protein